MVGLIVDATEFLERKAFNTTMIPSTRDLTIKIVNILYGTLLQVYLNLSGTVLTDLSIVATCSFRPYMYNKAGSKNVLKVALSNPLSPW